MKVNNYIWKKINTLSNVISNNILNVENSIKNWIFSILIGVSLQAITPIKSEWNSNLEKIENNKNQNILKVKNYFEIIDANINWKNIYRTVNWKKEAYWISPNDTIFFDGEVKIINWKEYYKIKLLNDRNITWYVKSSAFIKNKEFKKVNYQYNKDLNIKPEIKNNTNIEKIDENITKINKHIEEIEKNDEKNNYLTENESNNNQLNEELIIALNKLDFENKNIIKEEIKLNKENIEIEKITENNKENIAKIITENQYNNTENNETERRMNHIKEKLYDESFSENLDAVINTLEWEVINFKWKSIIFSKESVDKNKEIIKNNLITFLLYLIEIESDWDKTKKNPKSSAEWLWQWLTKNWKYETVYYDWKEWSLKKDDSKNYISEKTVYLTSSIETLLSNIKKEYENNNIIDDLHFIPKNFKKQNKINIVNIWLEKQLKLLCLSLSAYNQNKKIWKKYISSDKLIIKILLWDTDAIKVFYDYFHHTKPDKPTIARVDEILPKYLDKIIEVKDV